MKYRSSRLEETRTSVLRAIRDPGNQTAWNRFFDLYAGYLYSLARRSGLLDADADDVVQTVLVEVAGKMRDFTYDRSKGRFRGWLCQNCNTGAGMFNDDPDLLQAAADFYRS